MCRPQTTCHRSDCRCPEAEETRDHVLVGDFIVHLSQAWDIGTGCRVEDKERSCDYSQSEVRNTRRLMSDSRNSSPGARGSSER